MFGNSKGEAPVPRQENTKELILERAFGLFAKPRLGEMSLSELAAATGISKTAIFRHYKNKEDLLDAMRQRFFEALSQMFDEIGAGEKFYNLKRVERVIDCVFEFNKSRPNFLPYFLQTSFSDAILTEGVKIILQDNGVNLFNEDFFKEAKNFLPKKLIPSFFEQTLLIFLFVGLGGRDEWVSVNDPKLYKKALSQLIYSGLGKKKNPIAPERKKELDAICEIQFDDDEKTNRFLNAFVKLIQESGSSKITVEKIASALGMAKSSVYAFFANKRDYLVNMLFQETERMNVVLKERVALAKNCDEALYIMMKSQANYFARRPQVIMLHGYFVFQEAALPRENVERFRERTMTMLKSGVMTNIMPNAFNFPVNQNALLYIKWISGLTVGYMLMGTKYKLPPEWLDFYVSSVFEMIECGIKFACNDGE